MNKSLINKTEPETSTLKRIGWLILIWVCSVGALGIVALGMRLIMSYAGLTR
ncbi:hypothetical protein OURE66S_04573 [Oligella ureolytica]